MQKKNLHIDFDFVRHVEQAGPFEINACFQCRKCTNGCPVAFAMDLYPDEVIRLVILGEKSKVLSCKTIWVCAACETCTTRCPNNVKIAELMDYLKEKAINEGFFPPEPQILTLHQIFLNNIQKRGRIYEGELISQYMFKSGDFFKKIRDKSILNEIKLGWQLFIKGRMPLIPKKIKNKDKIKNILKKQHRKPI